MLFRSEKRHLAKMSDIDVVEAVSGENPYGLYAGFVQPVDISWASHSEAANIFKSSRSKHLKYIKTTTGDLRNRFIHLSLGWVDCYQFILFMTAYCDGHIRQIQDILSDPRFPAQ